MKKLLAVLQFVFLSTALLYAAPWGTYREDGATEESYESVSGGNQIQSRKPFKSSLVHSILLRAAMRGKVNVKIEYQGYTPSEEERKNEERVVREAISSWFRVAAKMIEDRHREQEFGVVYDILKQEQNISFDDSSAHITFRFYNDLAEVRRSCGWENAAGCYNWGGNIIKAERAENFYDESRGRTDTELVRILTHELGHAFGLSDQYEEQKYNHQDYSGSYTDREYGSPEESKDSVMNKAKDIGPDDVDGIINLIILELIAQGKTEKLPGEWLGFTGKYTYLNGKLVNGGNPSPEYFTVEEKTLGKASVYWEAQEAPVFYPPYADPRRAVVTSIFKLSALDGSVNIEKVIKEPIQMEKEILPSSITYGTGPNKESVLCYNYGLRTRCFGRKGDKVVWVQLFERQELESTRKDKPIIRTLYFQVEDVFVRMTWKFYEDGDLFLFDMLEEEQEKPYPWFRASFAPPMDDVYGDKIFNVQVNEKEPLFLQAENIEEQVKQWALIPSLEIVEPFMRK